MRLIDADKLLKNWGQTFFAIGGDRLGANGEEIMFYLNSLIREIKNAPTVETKECPYECETCAHKMVCAILSENGKCDYPFYQEAYQTGYEEGLNARPQGEWVGGDKVVYHGNLAVSGCWHCSNCGALPGVERNFCGRCGAIMKGGAE